MSVFVAQASHQYSVCLSLQVHSVAFISFPRKGGDTGRKCDLGICGRETGVLPHPILAAAENSRHVTSMSAMMEHRSPRPGGGKQGEADFSRGRPFTFHSSLFSCNNSPLIARPLSGVEESSLQMLTSLTSVGVQDRSTSSSIRLVSAVLLC